MKKRVRYILLPILSICMGCSDWLDVKPRTEMKEDELFETEDGFKTALTGAYIQLASANLYGKNTSMYFPEYLTHTWIAGTDEKKYPLDVYIPKWDYKHNKVEALIDDIWTSYYLCIAHLNNILSHLDGAEALFTNGNAQLIKGEALGLRGFLHAELLRFFGPVPGPGAGGKAAIPYVTEMTKDPNKLTTLSYDEVVAKILKDLDAAEICLEKDPLIENDNSHLNGPNKAWIDWTNRPNDEWQFYRQLRFNYYAVKGTKARLYHWIGDAQNAVKYAKQVIDSEKFRLSNESDYQDASNRDYPKNLVMLSEHLFGVSNPDHQSVIQDLFKTQSSRLTQSSDNVQKAYENIVGDIRNVANRYWEKRSYQNNATTNHFRKYSGSDNFTAQNVIPLLRLAELYFILIEDLPAGERDVYFEQYLIARNLPLEWVNRIAENDEVKNCLEKEYRKEFWGEGQMFFFYKRHNYESFTYPTVFTVPQGGYEIPRPQSQTVFD